jgi:hypothetical protein
MTTPPSMAIPLAPRQYPASTPQRGKHTHGESCRSGTLDDLRKAVLKDVGPIAVVPFEDFAEHVLPIVKDGHFDLNDASVESIYKECQNRDIIIPNDPNGLSLRWARFPTIPDKSKDVEPDFFESLIDLWNEIINVIVDTFPVQPITQMAHRPDSAQASERPFLSRPDGVLELIETSTVTKPLPTEKGRLGVWENTITAMEFKKASNDSNLREVGAVFAVLYKVLKSIS